MGRRRLMVLGAALGLVAFGATHAQPPADPLGQVIQDNLPPIPYELPPIEQPTEAPPPAPGETPAAIQTADTKAEEAKTTPAGPPPEAKKAEEAATTTRPRFPVGIVRVVDKVTAEATSFPVRLDRPVQFETLIFTMRACEANEAIDPARGATAHLQIDFQPPQVRNRAKPKADTLFRGWMYADSPSLSPLEHPVYDAWLISCRAA